MALLEFSVSFAFLVVVVTVNMLSAEIAGQKMTTTTIPDRVLSKAVTEAATEFAMDHSAPKRLREPSHWQVEFVADISTSTTVVIDIQEAGGSPSPAYKFTPHDSYGLTMPEGSASDWTCNAKFTAIDGKLFAKSFVFWGPSGPPNCSKCQWIFQDTSILVDCYDDRGPVIMFTWNPAT